MKSTLKNNYNQTRKATLMISLEKIFDIFFVSIIKSDAIGYLMVY